MSRKSVLSSTRKIGSMLDSASDVPVQKKVSVVMKKDLIFNEIEDLVPPTLL
ncbi:unnamed protein product, partial [Nesidiocoris tenuis]